MKFNAFFAAMVITGVTAGLIGCGVPKSEHEKIVQELQQAKQEMTSQTEMAAALTQEKESLSKQVADLQNQIGALKKENETLKGKLSPRKPASKTPAKTTPTTMPKRR